MIIYATTHGYTRKVAQALASRLLGEVTIHDLKDNRNPDFSSYDRVIIGGSIHAGSIQRRVREFCQNNLEKLTQKSVALFICCMYEGPQASLQLTNAYPAELHELADAETLLGGEFNFEKMNVLEKFVVKKVAKVDHTLSKPDDPALENFAERLNHSSH
jgi:menaquinone-dependent protoporphyrinogen oxidase